MERPPRTRATSTARVVERIVLATCSRLVSLCCRVESLTEDTGHFWAKTTPEGEPGISVRDHCLNVGCVAEALKDALPSAVKNLLPRAPSLSRHCMMWGRFPLVSSANAQCGCSNAGLWKQSAMSSGKGPNPTTPSSASSACKTPSNHKELSCGLLPPEHITGEFMEGASRRSDERQPEPCWKKRPAKGSSKN